MKAKHCINSPKCDLKQTNKKQGEERKKKVKNKQKSTQADS